MGTNVSLSRHPLRTIGFLFVLLAVLGTNTMAGSNKFKDVCASGCTYSSVQGAIDSINDSSATKAPVRILIRWVQTLGEGAGSGWPGYFAAEGLRAAASCV